MTCYEFDTVAKFTNPGNDCVYDDEAYQLSAIDVSQAFYLSNQQNGNMEVQSQQ